MGDLQAAPVREERVKGVGGEGADAEPPVSLLLDQRDLLPTGGPQAVLVEDGAQPAKEVTRQVVVKGNVWIMPGQIAKKRALIMLSLRQAPDHSVAAISEGAPPFNARISSAKQLSLSKLPVRQLMLNKIDGLLLVMFSRCSC